MEHKQNSQSGLIQIIVLAVVVIALLAYFKVDVRGLVNKPVVQKLFNIFVVAWGTYIKPMFSFLFTSITAVFKK